MRVLKYTILPVVCRASPAGRGLQAVQSLLAALLLLTPLAHAQQDAWWLFGIPPDNSYTFDFRQEEMVFQSMEHGGVTHNGPTISSPDGELLFYSNGHGVLNRNHKFMHNAQGDSLLAPAWANEGGGASILPEHTLILPMPGRDSLFYVIYFDGPSQPRHRASTLKYTVVNLKLNNGLGGLEQMNTVLATQDTFIGVHLEAIRHANGRDWWVPVYRPAAGRKGFYRFLVQEDTITGPYFQEVKNINDHPWVQRVTYPLCASPNGALLGIAFNSNRLVILDFDRCTGAISIRHTAQPVPVAKPELADSGSQLVGCSFSPNNRYFYLSRSNFKLPWDPGEDTFKGVLAQYDLHLAADSLDTTTETIIYASDSVDYGVMDSGKPIWFTNHQLGPDGKIYIGCSHSGRFVHVIESPDSAGEKCDLAFAKYFMPGVINKAGNLPVNFPNFRLGAVPTYRARAGPDTVIKEGGAARLGSPGVEGVVYSWSPAAGLDKPNHPQPVAAPDATTTYYLTVTDTNPSPKHSCTVRTDSVTVTVEHPPEPPPEPIRIPTLLLPEQHKPVFYIHGLPEQSRLRVYNALGQEVYAAEHYQNDWDISRLAAAMYFYVLEMPPDKVPEGEAHVRRGKLVVVR